MANESCGCGHTCRAEKGGREGGILQLCQIKFLRERERGRSLAALEHAWNLMQWDVAGVGRAAAAAAAGACCRFSLGAPSPPSTYPQPVWNHCKLKMNLQHGTAYDTMMPRGVAAENCAAAAPNRISNFPNWFLLGVGHATRSLCRAVPTLILWTMLRLSLLYFPIQQKNILILFPSHRGIIRSFLFVWTRWSQ